MLVCKYYGLFKPEQFYDPVANCGFLINFIRQRRSRCPDIETRWTVRCNRLIFFLIVFSTQFRYCIKFNHTLECTVTTYWDHSNDER